MSIWFNVRSYGRDAACPSYVTLTPDVRLFPIEQRGVTPPTGMFEDVQLGTAIACGYPYTRNMNIDHVKAALMATWILTVGLLGYLLGATSFVGWTALAAITMTPPVLMMRLWRVPSPSMSESIREVLR
jgi:hypothetical protein